MRRRGGPHGIDRFRAVQLEDLDDPRQARQEMDRTLPSYLDGLSEELLDETVGYELPGERALAESGLVPLP